LHTRNFNEWTIDRWRIEPRYHPLDIEVSETAENPPLWKDIAVASLIALGFWAMAALVLV
jgi:hypothetical protein